MTSNTSKNSNLLIPEKVRWIYEKESKEQNTPRIILGKRKYSKINQGLELQSKYGTKQATERDLLRFQKLYVQMLKDKKNAKIHNVEEQMKKRIKNEEIFFAYIEDKKENLLGAAIITIKEIFGQKTLIMGYRAYDLSKEINGVRLGYHLEYLYYNLSDKLEIERLSRGKDRNGYGELGTTPGLAMHKLEQKFMPYYESRKDSIKIQGNKGLYFCTKEESPNERGKLEIATIGKELKINENSINILQKRGFTLIDEKGRKY